MEEEHSWRSSLETLKTDAADFRRLLSQVDSPSASTGASTATDSRRHLSSGTGAPISPEASLLLIAKVL